MTHLAIDLALTRTGIAWGPGPTDHDTIVCPPKLSGGERLNWWSKAIAGYAVSQYPSNEPAELVVEGPFLHRQHPVGSVNTIKLHGVVELFAWRHDLAYYTVPPTVLKAGATGRGNATKADMLSAARAAGFEGDSPDGVDAWLLWKYWAEHAAETVT